MPVVGGGLQVLLSICMIIHILKTGQDKSWLYLVWIPGLGPLAYFLIIIMPDLMRSRNGRKIMRGVQNKLNPDRELKQAQDDFELAATVGHRLRLADALFEKAHYAEAISHYQTALAGAFENDADLMLKLARAQLEAGQAQAAWDTLADFRTKHPKHNTPEGHLLFARCCVSLGQQARAREEYDVLIGYYAGFEAKSRYIDALIDWQDMDTASTQLTALLADIKRAPPHVKELNAPWVAQTKKQAAAMKRT